MAEPRYVEDILKAIQIKEEIHGLVEPKHRKPAKYRVSKENPKQRPDMKVGQKLVSTVGSRRWFGSNYGDREGYALGVVIDFVDDSYDGSSSQFAVIVQVTRVSNPKHEDMIGHLRTWRVGGWEQGTHYYPQEITDLAPYKLTR